jgi:hypothetical protein
MVKKKIYLNCGYELDCLHKDCINCPKKAWHKINFTLAEEIAVEDFAVCDLNAMINGCKLNNGLICPDKKAELELLQNIMRKLMSKLFKSENNEKWRRL